MMLAPVFAVVDVPLEAQGIDVVLDFLAVGAVEVCQKAVQQFTAAHSRRWLCWSRKIDVDDFRHQFLVLDCCSHAPTPSFYL